MGIISIGQTIIYDDTGNTQQTISSIPCVFASSEFSTSYVATNAIDNVLTNAWSAIGAVGQFIGIDFKMPTKILNLYLEDRNNRLRNFVLEGSDNGSNYTIVLTATRAQNTSMQSFAVPSHDGYRFFRVRCTGSLYIGSNFMMTNLNMDYIYA